MLSYISFNISADCAKAFLFKAKPRAVFFSSPPVPGILPGLGMARRNRVPFILDVRDLWPEIAVALGIMHEGSLIHRYLARIVRKAYHAASAVIVTTPGDAEAVGEWGVDPSRITVIPNGANLQVFNPNPGARREIRDKLNVNDELIVVYSGSFGHGMNDLDTLLETAFLLREAEGIRFLLVGEGDRRAEFEAEAAKRHIENIIYIPSQPPEELNTYLNAADVGYIPRRGLECDTGGNVPVKMFEYMAVGLPVVMNCIPGCEAEGIHKTSGAVGVCLRAGDATEAAKWLYEARENIASLKAATTAGREFVIRNYSRSEGVRKLNEVLSRVLEEADSKGKRD